MTSRVHCGHVHVGDQRIWLVILQTLQILLQFFFAHIRESLLILLLVLTWQLKMQCLLIDEHDFRASRPLPETAPLRRVCSNRLLNGVLVMSRVWLMHLL